MFEIAFLQSAKLVILVETALKFVGFALMENHATK